MGKRKACRRYLLQIRHYLLQVPAQAAFFRQNVHRFIWQSPRLEADPARQPYQGKK